METDESLKVLNPVQIAEKVANGEFTLEERPGRSRVWKIFARIIYPNGEEVREFVYCRSCEKVFCFNKQSTSNLVKHRCFQEIVLNRDDANSTSEIEKPIIEAVESPIDNLSKVLTRWIIKECRPIDFMQNEDLVAVFQEFTRLGANFGSDIDVKSLLPEVSVVAKSISEIYEQCFNRVKAEIALIKDDGFGLTTNIWTDNFTKQSYIALTIHYLKNGVLISHLLGLKRLEDGKSKNQNIAEKVKYILEDFGCKLSNKSLVVTDEGGDILKAIADNQILPCISQIITNVLQKSVDEVPEVSSIVSACLKSVSVLKNIGLSNVFGDLLQTSTANRWVTTCKILKSVETNWSEIEKSLKKLNDSEQILNINLNHLKAVTKIFQKFEEAIETLEDDSCATLHLVIVYLHELNKSCDTNNSEFKDLSFIERLKKNMRFYLDKIVTENMTTLHKLALFLYPPTNKLILFDDNEKKFIEGECLRLIKSFKNELQPVIKQEPDSHTSPVVKRRNVFSDFVESETNCDPNGLIVQEIQHYKNTRAVYSADFDVLSWWELQKNNFPLLYKLSCTILATPATSAASKRIFLTASNLIFEKSKYSTTEMEIEKIMFINSNAEHDELDSHFSF